ncbi:major facilitator superfamily domain-containing protein 6-like [Myzus persicae]|uniref:major facilitator superfamily domain-containing protein 6-like n=1 Tax=Myzus persicae TaxID=13164 RepID=UPI000B930272|nr:major facilitator superfamily domain-containing protein 6-like [Myzus persicae]XP_022179019.1 major facilitator superfamily domain-containing protein 6-like [Myzus persicae]XP_022179020.1 major facilitator superfamily domain-containing protein 6-like [Myzus persicae]XP_022179021.1 major facilitator superfamily domain-containing protein 6-like [Myzus persicae]
MIFIKVNTQLLPLKMCFFFMFACFGPMVGFLPTIAKQLGYSLTTYGASMTFMSVVSTILVPLSGVIVDKFRIKKTLFLVVILGMGVVALLFLFVPKAPLDLAITELKCDAKTTSMTVFNENNNLQTTNNITHYTVANHNSSDDLITCKLNCQYAELCGEGYKINNLKNQSDLSDLWMKTINDIENQNKYNQIDLTLMPKDVEQTEQIANSYIFQVLSVQINGTQILSPTCQCNLKTFCHITNCSNQKIIDVATSTTYRGNVLTLYQFWIFFTLVATFWACCTIASTIINPICLDTLGEKSAEDFGKQKCWGSIGWGGFSIFIGWLVDVFSFNKKDKDYSPVFYSTILITAFNFGVVKQIKVVETNKSEGRWKNMCGLFTKYYMISFCVWSIFNTLFHTIVTHFLFWYMEDLVAANNDPSQRAWLKTLQGLAQGIQCFGGEIPFFFWSGWIIRKMGYGNCMALVLAAMAVRMYLYTVIWNPVWIIAIELLNGVSYALGYSVKMSYAKMLAPPDTLNTIIGFIGFFDCIGESIGSLVGGYLFDTYGGVWSFRFFSYMSLLMCSITILTNYFGLTKESTTLKDNAESTNMDLKITNNNADKKI